MENKVENEKKDTESTHRLEEIIESFCGKMEGYKFVLDSSTPYYRKEDDENLIGIDKNFFSEVENLIKYDKKYLSALKMTVYHEIGHSLFDGFYDRHAREAKEAVASLYEINRGSIEDYIIEIAVLSNTLSDEIYRVKQTLKEPKDEVEYLLKRDYADKWERKLFLFYTYGPTEKMIKDAFDKINLSYKEMFERALMEREGIDSLKRKNNLFIDKDMISRK